MRLRWSGSRFIYDYPREEDTVTVNDYNAWLRVHGKADWIWDEELGTQIPCCSVLVRRTLLEGGGRLNTRVHCGQGPLVGDQIKSGDCGGHTT